MKGKPIQIIEAQPKDGELPKYRECIQSAYHAVDREGNKVPVKEILDDLSTASREVATLNLVADNMVTAIEAFTGSCPLYLADWFQPDGACNIHRSDIHCPNRHSCWLEYFRDKVKG